MTPVDFRKPLMWNLLKDDDLLRPKVDRVMDGNAEMDRGQLLNLHAAVNLRERSHEDVQDEKQRQTAKKIKFQKYITELHEKAGFSRLKEEIECKLCGVYLQHPKELQLHLATKRHREEETKWLL